MRRDDTGYDHEEHAQWALWKVNSVMKNAGILPDGYELCYDHGITATNKGEVAAADE